MRLDSRTRELIAMDLQRCRIEQDRRRRMYWGIIITSFALAGLALAALFGGIQP